tara:strand:+ start:180 stop:908 length:729 start_codon:yes stop_codon:yes gene_type:complete
MPINRLAGNILKNKIFQFQDGKLVPTDNTKKLTQAGQEWNPDLEVVPYNSVEAMGGEPMWGSGGGHYNFVDDPNKVYVDPFADTHVIAHEIGHAVAPAEQTTHRGGGRYGSAEKFDQNFSPSSNVQHPSNAPKRSGARLRAAHELIGKPKMIEEASAQGFAIGLQQRLGIQPTNNDWNNPYEYPATFMRHGPGAYMVNENVGTSGLNKSEQTELDTIEKSYKEAIKREYVKGYERGRYGPTR